ncbi:hypothetical protein BE20_04795 [Sorangium cellulosum]|nr:hypothetical protein BE20_04795 [Sorangium cellulosum]
MLPYKTVVSDERLDIGISEEESLMWIDKIGGLSAGAVDPQEPQEVIDFPLLLSGSAAQNADGSGFTITPNGAGNARIHREYPREGTSWTPG